MRVLRSEKALQGVRFAVRVSCSELHQVPFAASLRNSVEYVEPTTSRYK